MLFSPYKDITINMNWNTNVISTQVTGTFQGLLTVLPTNLRAVTWAFATGECGSENWGGLPGNAVAAANVQSFVSMGKSYIISTGGAAGSFHCGSDAAFEAFIQRYNSSRLVGIDFDIEAGQTPATIAAIVQRVKVARVNHPNLRFSFTIATLGGNQPQSLGQTGVNVINAIKAANLQGYLINLMVMDYGSTTPGNCTIVNGRCDMGKSAIAAAESLHNFHGVPYNQIELTPMIGGNDTIDETFDLGDITELSNYLDSEDCAACTTGRGIATAIARRALRNRRATATARPARSASPPAS